MGVFSIIYGIFSFDAGVGHLGLQCDLDPIPTKHATSVLLERGDMLQALRENLGEGKVEMVQSREVLGLAHRR